MIKQFFKPTSLEEALLIKEKYGDSITWFAGGTYFNHSTFLAVYDKVISLEGLGLHAIHTKNNQTSIGATVTLQKLIDNSLIPTALRRAAANTATRTVRNMATVGGDIAIGGLRSGLIPCLLALNANVVTDQNQDSPLEDYLQDSSRSLILKITIPEQQQPCRIEQFTQKANTPVVIKVAVSIDLTEKSKPKNAIVAIGGIDDSPRRLPEVEALVNTAEPIDRKEIEQVVSAAVSPRADLLGSVTYKKYIAGIVVADCLMNCLEQG